MIGQLQLAAVALGGASGDGQSQAMPGRGLAGSPEERLAELGQVLVGHAGAMVANADHQVLAVVLGAQLHRHPFWIEAQGIAQQIVQRTLEHIRPARVADPGFDTTVDTLRGGDDTGVVLQLFEHIGQIDVDCRAGLGIQPRVPESR